MPHKNDHSSASHTDAMPLTAWLGATAQPSTIAIIWRLSLPYAPAAALLAELHRTTPAVSAMGLVGESGVRLYLWQRTVVPGFQQRVVTVDATAMLVNAEQIAGGAVWACGRALVRLLAGRASTSEREDASAPRVEISEV